MAAGRSASVYQEAQKAPVGTGGKLKFLPYVRKLLNRSDAFVFFSWAVSLAFKASFMMPCISLPVMVNVGHILIDKYS